jgi:hypothetical protein
MYARLGSIITRNIVSHAGVPRRTANSKLKMFLRYTIHMYNRLKSNSYVIVKDLYVTVEINCILLIFLSCRTTVIQKSYA